MIKQKHILGFISVQYKTRSYNGDRISSVIVRVLASSAVDYGFEPLSGQSKDYKIGGIYCFSTKHAALMRKCKDWLTRRGGSSGGRTRRARPP